jgi:hypothetical protein
LGGTISDEWPKNQLEVATVTDPDGNVLGLLQDR